MLTILESGRTKNDVGTQRGGDDVEECLKLLKQLKPTSTSASTFDESTQATMIGSCGELSLASINTSFRIHAEESTNGEKQEEDSSRVEGPSSSAPKQTTTATTESKTLTAVSEVVDYEYEETIPTPGKMCRRCSATHCPYSLDDALLDVKASDGTDSNGDSDQEKLGRRAAVTECILDYPPIGSKSTLDLVSDEGLSVFICQDVGLYDAPNRAPPIRIPRRCAVTGCVLDYPPIGTKKGLDLEDLENLDSISNLAVFVCEELPPEQEQPLPDSVPTDSEDSDSQEDDVADAVEKETEEIPVAETASQLNHTLNPYGYEPTHPEEESSNPYGYESHEPVAENTNMYGYEAQQSNPYGYEAQDSNPYGYETESNPYGYETESNPYGYETTKTTPSSNPYGYEASHTCEDVPQEQPKPRRRRPQRRCSVTKYSLEEIIQQVQQEDKEPVHDAPVPQETMESPERHDCPGCNRRSNLRNALRRIRQWRKKISKEGSA